LQDLDREYPGAFYLKIEVFCVVLWGAGVRGRYFRDRFRCGADFGDSQPSRWPENVRSGVVTAMAAAAGILNPSLTVESGWRGWLAERLLPVKRQKSLSRDTFLLFQERVYAFIQPLVCICRNRWFYQLGAADRIFTGPGAVYLKKNGPGATTYVSSTGRTAVVGPRNRNRFAPSE
jgi:hypothetical protein